MTPETQAGPGRVLVVDDDPDLLYTIRLFLELDGHRVISASNVNDALIALDAEPIEVVVTDLVLPGLSGLDLLTALRRAREDVEVVLLTGHGDLDTATDALRHRAFDYLHKPISGTAIRGTVRRALEAWRVRARDRARVELTSERLSELEADAEKRTRELRESEARYRQLVESLPIAIVEIDVATDRFTYAGGALVTAFEPRFGGRLPDVWTAAVHPDDRIEVGRIVREAADGTKRDEPLDLRMGTASEGWVWLRAISMQGDGMGRVVCVLFDITERRQAEAEKARLELELGEARTKLEAALIGGLDLQVGTNPSRIERGPSMPPPPSEGAVFGVSRAIRRIEDVAKLASEHDQPVLILGETGTGKGVVARYIHDRSGRGAFVALNCSSMRGELLDSELFGHARGAFTSAVKDRRGLVEEASGGTLFLDEVGETSPDTQARLLKLLEERTFRRVGETAERKSDFRLVCATNRDLESEAASGRFRRDLLYRINLFTLEIAPLREREGDVRWLVPRILGTLGATDVRIEPATWALLEQYDWPGNVRELRNAIIRATLLARGAPLSPDHFAEIRRSVLRGSSDFGAPRPAPTAAESDASAPRPVLAERAERVEPNDAASPTDVESDERTRIVSLLARCDGNRAKVARILGVSRTTLYKKLRAYGLADADA